MTTTTTPAETGPDGSPLAHWTAHHVGPGPRTTWTRHTWPVAAAGALAEAFAAGTASHRSAIVSDDTGDVIGYLVSAERMQELEAASHQLEQLAEQPADEPLHPAIHGPKTGGDALMIDIEDLQEATAHAIALINLDAFGTGRDGGITRDEVMTERERIMREHTSALIGAAVEIGYKVRLYPDTNGVVPVLAWASEGDTVGRNDERWTLAYYIDGARGLYARPGAGFFGDEWAIITGAGYKLRASFLDRDVACDYARAVANALPGLDWRVFDAQLSTLPDAVRAKLIETNAAWSSIGPRKQPAEA